VKADLIATRAISPVEKCVKTLVNNFGYTAKHYAADEWDSLQAHLKARHAQRVMLESKKPDKSMEDFYAKISTKTNIGRV
jgi:hypothetical protein